MGTALRKREPRRDYSESRSVTLYAGRFAGDETIKEIFKDLAACGLRRDLKAAGIEIWIRPIGLGFAGRLLGPDRVFVAITLRDGRESTVDETELDIWKEVIAKMPCFSTFI